MSNIIECRSLSFSYIDGNNQTSVLNNLNFEVELGDSIAILGQSGCGKSTLLNLIAGLDSPSEGDVLINNINIAKLNEKDRTELRSNNFGFVYQFHHLLNDFSSIYNVALPLLIRGDNKESAILNSKKILTKVGLENRLNHNPSELSGGERQRVAIARAMVTEPACILADEPTGNLDAKNAKDVLELILELNENNTTSLLIVTHDLSIANKMNRKLTLSNSKLVDI
ncbi:MAG: ABC transporter ATP-binding protein [Candidatus Pseudothioglobus sp.]|jgi:lipoprotein-releasing system ATP-binding protein|nr:ABC transporter ATP-binding protein [Candidatus Thioglobus sp.]HIL45167.1 ABC transporter ATP-binding protein [Candidatus Thioglobus sp.]